MEKDKGSFRLLLIIAVSALAFFSFVFYQSGKDHNQEISPKEIKSYAERLEDNASSGDADAMYALGYMYKTGDGAEKNYKKAVKLFKKARKAGNASASVNLANMYRYGHGVEQSYKKALELWEEAAAQGHATAQFNLARAYYKGLGVERDYLKSGKYMSLSAKNGDQNAQGMIARYSRRCHETRVGSRIYYDMRSCYLAAYSGDPIAMHAVGLSFYDGRFNQKIDYRSAFKWFEKSAVAGGAESQYYLSMFYDKGYGVEPSKVESYAWIGTGLAQKDYSVRMLRKAKRAKEVLHGQMSDEHRLEAEEKLKVYVEKYAAQK